MGFQKNEIIVRNDLKYPKGALLVDGYDASGALLAHPLGGGFQIRISQEEQLHLARISADEITPIYRRGIFTLEGIDGEFPGWTHGRNWNGWAMPQFEFAEAQRLIVALDTEIGSYESGADVFITAMEGGDEETWPAEVIHLPDGGRVKVYPIGTGSWIWEEEDAL